MRTYKLLKPTTKLSVCVVSLLLYTAACTTDNNNGWGDDMNNVNPPTGNSSDEEAPSGNTPDESADGSDSSATLLDFDVSWSDVPDAEYVETSETVVTDKSHEEYDDFVENSTFASTIMIDYSDTSASVSGEVSGVTVATNGAHVVVNSSVAGVEYVLSGQSSNGSFKVYSDKKLKLTLAGVSLTNGSGAAVNIQSGKRVFVELKDGTDNKLTDAATYSTVSGEDEKGCFFSEGQLIFSGTGSLTVKGNSKHGICSDDYVRFRSGCNVTIASAVKDGVHTNEKVIVSGGKLTVTASSDGIECEKGFIDIRGGEITVTATDDAIVASYEENDTSITPYISVSGGLLKLCTTGDKGMGLKATGNITVAGGILKAEVKGAASKAITADGDVLLSGGKMVLLTSGEGLYEDNDISSAAGIKCDGNMKINGTALYIKSTGAAGKGISCDATLSIDNSTVKIITKGKQYVYNRLDSSAKGIKADGALSINSGFVWVKTLGGEGSEGIESKSSLTINGGDIGVYSYDDCMNASNSIVINGGNIYCYSTGNDGVDSNGTLTITGGTIVSIGTTSPEEGFDCDQNTFKITGGTILGIGGATSTPTSSACTQRTVIYGGTGTNGSLFTILGSGNMHVMSYVIPRSYSQMTLLFSSAKLAANVSHTIYSGGTLGGGSAFCGLTIGGNYTAGTQTATFTTGSMVTSVGNSSSGGQGGGVPGGGGPGGRW